MRVFSKLKFIALVKETERHIREVIKDNPEMSVFEALEESDYPFAYSPANYAIKNITGQWPDKAELKRHVMTDWDYMKFVRQEIANYNAVYG